MVLMRRFEEKAWQLYSTGKIFGFCHLYIGQEAVMAGVNDVKRSVDSVITAYRAHGAALLSGMTPQEVMAELTGRSGGCSKGKGGSMHMFSPANRFYGGHGIVGAQVSLGTGLAFAHKYNEDGGVCLAFFGDGAANQGQVYESMNMAALWHLPVVYIIENNQYAMGTSVARAAAGGNLYQRGESMGIPGKRVDGMDVLAVREAVSAALEYARNSGPVLLEMMTYRYRGHSMSDPATYRTRDEVDSMKKNDPIKTIEAYMCEKYDVTRDELKKIADELQREVELAAEFALNCPEPDSKELLTDVVLKNASSCYL